jgi:CheY-like chemotaxis protein
MSDTRGGAADPTALGTRRVLVVDDDELILEVAQMSLEAVGGWHVTTANSGQEGLERAVSERPDAIVMDVMMPGMDGPTTAVALRENPVTANIPIVLLTAKAQGKGQSDLSALPVVGVLGKPFDPMLLPATLASMLGWS